VKKVRLSKKRGKKGIKRYIIYMWMEKKKVEKGEGGHTRLRKNQ